METTGASPRYEQHSWQFAPGATAKNRAAMLLDGHMIEQGLNTCSTLLVISAHTCLPKEKYYGWGLGLPRGSFVAATPRINVVCHGS